MKNEKKKQNKTNKKKIIESYIKKKIKKNENPNFFN